MNGRRTECVPGRGKAVRPMLRVGARLIAFAPNPAAKTSFARKDRKGSRPAFAGKLIGGSSVCFWSIRRFGQFLANAQGPLRLSDLWNGRYRIGGVVALLLATGKTPQSVLLYGVARHRSPTGHDVMTMSEMPFAASSSVLFLRSADRVGLAIFNARHASEF
jgi:hypothetical protein